MEIDLANLERRERDLTVIRGALGTVLSHWDEIDEASCRELLHAALERVEDLVQVLEHDCRPLRSHTTAA